MNARSEGLKVAGAPARTSLAMLASAKRRIVARVVAAALGAVVCLAFAPPARAAAAAQCIAEVASMYLESDARAAAADDGPAWLCPLGEPSPVSDGEVPICLIEGASAVAPLPIRSIGDARIEATSRCNSPDGPDMVTPSPDPERQLSPEMPAPALLPTLAVQPGARLMSVQRQARPAGQVPARGYGPSVYRPPRS